MASVRRLSLWKKVLGHGLMQVVWRDYARRNILGARSRTLPWCTPLHHIRLYQPPRKAATLQQGGRQREASLPRQRSDVIQTSWFPEERAQAQGLPIVLPKF